MSDFFDQVRTSGGIAIVTLEPFSGLSAVTAAACNDFGDLCAQKEAQGIGGIMVRFAHEMNGNWYAWGQQPTLYRQTFQLLASSVHTRTVRTAMIWSPNNGIGYPFGTGAFTPASGSPNFLELDTNHDGTLSSADDMFDPFYPGDASVDWVGLTIYHWGVNYPWLENETPSGSEFASVINASSPGSPANYSRWFYPRYCSDGIHNKPFIVAETSAFYNTEQPGANELAMKQAWFRQLYNISGASADGPDVATTFPKMKCVNWFDHYKRESEAQNQFVDWRASANPLVRNAFVTAVRTLRSGQSYFLTAQEMNIVLSSNGIIGTDLPAILPMSGNVNAVLTVKAQNACDLEVDLLDQSFAFKGGTRIPVPAGTTVVPVSFALNQMLSDGAAYRWSIFLTPTGGTYLNTISRLTTPDSIARIAAPYANILSSPVSPTPASQIPVRVEYVADSSMVLTVSLFNASHDLRGSGTWSVKRGTGLLDVNVVPLAGNPAGPYTLQCTLTNPTLLAQSIEFPIEISATPSGAAATLAIEPTVIPVGEVFRFTVGYATSFARDLRIELSSSTGALVATAVQPIPAGSSSLDMTISYPLATAGAYTARAFVVPTGGTAAQAVASSPARDLQVVSAAYSQWALSRWGVVLASDPIDPQLDPDGDGSANSSEYAALTDPGNPASILRPTVARTGNQFTVSWPSSSGRNYQLFSRSALSSGSWTPANGMQAGNGSTMTFSTTIGSSGPANFYRVQATVP